MIFHIQIKNKQKSKNLDSIFHFWKLLKNIFIFSISSTSYSCQLSDSCHLGSFSGSSSSSITPPPAHQTRQIKEVKINETKIVISEWSFCVQYQPTFIKYIHLLSHKMFMMLDFVSWLCEADSWCRNIRTVLDDDWILLVPILFEFDRI